MHVILSLPSSLSPSRSLSRSLALSLPLSLVLSLSHPLPPSLSSLRSLARITSSTTVDARRSTAATAAPAGNSAHGPRRRAMGGIGTARARSEAGATSAASSATRTVEMKETTWWSARKLPANKSVPIFYDFFIFWRITLFGEGDHAVVRPEAVPAGRPRRDHAPAAMRPRRCLI